MPDVFFDPGIHGFDEGGAVVHHSAELRQRLGVQEHEGGHIEDHVFFFSKNFVSLRPGDSERRHRAEGEFADLARAIGHGRGAERFVVSEHFGIYHGVCFLVGGWVGGLEKFGEALLVGVGGVLGDGDDFAVALENDLARGGLDDAEEFVAVAERGEHVGHGVLGVFFAECVGVRGDPAHDFIGLLAGLRVVRLEPKDGGFLAGFPLDAGGGDCGIFKLKSERGQDRGNLDVAGAEKGEGHLSWISRLWPRSRCSCGPAGCVRDQAAVIAVL
jgi:hypothetical protein